MVAMSSNEATTSSIVSPNTISAARIAAVSMGSATASLTVPPADRNGNTMDSRRKRREKPSTLGLGRQQVRQAYALQLEEPGHLVGEFGGRQVGGFPQFPQRLDGGRTGLAGAGRAAGGQGIFLEKVSAKFLG